MRPICAFVRCVLWHVLADTLWVDGVVGGGGGGSCRVASRWSASPGVRSKTSSVCVWKAPRGGRGEERGTDVWRENMARHVVKFCANCVVICCVNFVLVFFQKQKHSVFTTCFTAKFTSVFTTCFHAIHASFHAKIWPKFTPVFDTNSRELSRQNARQHLRNNSRNKSHPKSLHFPRHFHDKECIFHLFFDANLHANVHATFSGHDKMHTTIRSTPLPSLIFAHKHMST